MQSGCSLDAVWMRSRCGLDEVWMRPGCTLVTVWMQFGLFESVDVCFLITIEWFPTLKPKLDEGQTNEMVGGYLGDYIC